MQPITGLDATFLYGETPTSPMHVGSVAIIEGSIEFETFRKIIASRLHLVPKLRQRLVYVPMSIDYPYWVDDPNFDIDLHINRIALPKPGGWSELRSIASHIFSQPLDRSRPLWSFTFVEGLDTLSQVPEGSIAVITKIHHVAIDGVAGAGILSLLFDMTPKVKPIPDPKPWEPEPLPSEISMVFKSAVGFATKPLKLPRLITDTLTATLKAGFLTRAQHQELPTAPFTAPKTPLNGIISSRRKWNASILSLERIKNLKRTMETTVNDIMLAICSGALRRYLLEKGKLPRKPLVAMVPVSTRAKTDTSNTGNQVSAMLVQLATQIEDPIERLEKIYENTSRGKTYQGAMGAKALSTLAETVPFGVANQASRLYSQYKLAKLHNPAFNVVITNVPGPQIPLFLNGHKLHSVMGSAPIIDGMGLMITIFSYNGLVMLSVTSDANSMPDVDVFTRYLRESANELEKCIQEWDKNRENGEPIRKNTADSDALFEHIEKFMNDNPTTIRANSGVYQFHVTGDHPSDWSVDLTDQPGKVTKGVADEPLVTLTVRDDHLMRIARKELDIPTAFIQGRIKVKGNSKKAMTLNKIFSLIPAME